VDLEVSKVRERLQEYQLDLRLTEAARGYLAEKGYDPNLGARPLRRVIQTDVEDALSEGVLAGRFGENVVVVVDVQDEELVFQPEATKQSEPTAEVEDEDAPQVLETVLN
jgi:ATP-dependent Clp protease ATP-binding subunit ClpA